MGSGGPRPESAAGGSAHWEPPSGADSSGSHRPVCVGGVVRGGSGLLLGPQFGKTVWKDC